MYMNWGLNRFNQDFYYGAKGLQLARSHQNSYTFKDLQKEWYSPSTNLFLTTSPLSPQKKEKLNYIIRKAML